MRVDLKFIIPYLSLLLWFLTLPLHGQSEALPFEKAFNGGQQAYFQLLKKELAYPLESMKNETQGVLIYAITLDPQKGPSFKLLTRLDGNIEAAISGALAGTSRYWSPVQKPITYYHAVFFGVGKPLASAMKPVEGYKSSFEPPWIEPVEITALMKVVKTVVSSSGDAGSQENTTTTATPAPLPPNAYREYQRAVSQYNKRQKKGKYKKAYSALSTAIRYNPFDITLVEARMKLEQELGVGNYALYDNALFEMLK